MTPRARARRRGTAWAGGSCQSGSPSGDSLPHCYTTARGLLARPPHEHATLAVAGVSRSTWARRVGRQETARSLSEWVSPAAAGGNRSGDPRARSLPLGGRPRRPRQSEEGAGERRGALTAHPAARRLRADLAAEGSPPPLPSGARSEQPARRLWLGPRHPDEIPGAWDAGGSVKGPNLGQSTRGACAHCRLLRAVAGTSLAGDAWSGRAREGRGRDASGTELRAVARAPRRSTVHRVV